MDKDKGKIEKIYSRSRMKIPKVQCFFTKEEEKHHISYYHTKKIAKIMLMLTITFLVASMILKAIEPIIDSKCINMAKAIATRISNEQATIVMNDYQYDDLMKITKDEEGNIKFISSDIIIINKIISDIPNLIQKELEKDENHKFYIRLGSFTGSKLLAGRGPNITIKVATTGNIETDLKSEFSEAGINQTLHRIYLEVRCNVTILTPFHSIEEQIVNQVLLAEGVIVGNIPSTYYNLQGLNQNNAIDLIE